MQYHRIPHSSLEVSTLGLGTMTFGEQNSEADAHAQHDYAVAQGINLIDVAEMYPVPPRPETQGLTETYVGNWLAKHGSREKLIIASSLADRRAIMTRATAHQALDRKNIREALHDSLKRLQTDYLDLYQVHWPQRPKPTASANSVIAGQILRLRFRCWIRWTHWQSTNEREKFVISACRTKLHLA
ncbi:aldo/keto reductase [Escherichia coli]